MVLVYHCLACQLRHTHDAVGIIHSVFLNRIHRRVHISSAPVKIRGMHVDAERFATNPLGMDAGWVSKPVVGVDDVEILGASHHSSYYGIVVYLIVEI